MDITKKEISETTILVDTNRLSSEEERRKKKTVKKTCDIAIGVVAFGVSIIPSSIVAFLVTDPSYNPSNAIAVILLSALGGICQLGGIAKCCCAIFTKD